MLAPPKPKLWIPKQVLITQSAQEHAHGRAIAERAGALGAEVQELPGDRLLGLRDGDPKEVYRRAKSTLAVVVAPPSVRRPKPIPPSADWQFHIAQGCPAHCQYCYLAGSLPGPPVTRAYANLDEILAELPAYEGRGEVTSPSEARAHEGTTFEASCYTDPLGLEHLTGSLAHAVEWFGSREASSLRFTTKFDGVEPLLGLLHGGRTRPRVSLNVPEVARRFEGGTAPVPARLDALRRLAADGYPVGAVIAPVMPVDGWEESYGALLDELDDLPDVTIEVITHRFTDGSKEILNGWYPASVLDMDEEARSRKRTRFGGGKWVYPAAEMRAMRAFFTERAGGRLLYFT